MLDEMEILEGEDLNRNITAPAGAGGPGDGGRRRQDPAHFGS
jgi:hypothetical protein